MNQRFFSAFLSCCLGVLLLAGLGSCSLYHKVVHPYRLPTPKPSPEYLAKLKAEKEAQDKLKKEGGGMFKKKDAATEEAATDIAMPSGAAVASTAPTTATRTLPEKSTVRYDKHEMMKKPKLKRRKIHNYSRRFHPLQSIHNFFKYGLHPKPNYDPKHKPVPKQPKEALPDEAMPDAQHEPKNEPEPTGKP